MAQFDIDVLEERDREERSFLGGLRTPQGFVLWPLVRLSLSDDGIRLASLVQGHTGLASVRTLQPSEIVMAERISRVTIFPAPGVRLLLDGGQNPLIFWTLFPGRVLDALERDGVTVSRRGRAAPFWGT